MKNSLRFIITATTFLLFASSILAHPSDMHPNGSTVLLTLKKFHPTLVLTDERLKELKEKAVTDPLLKKIMKDILERSEILLREKPANYGKISPFLEASRECLRRVYYFGLAWRLTGEETYAQRAVDTLLSVCDLKDWNPNHFLDTAEMTHAVGVGYDWLYIHMDEKTREKIRMAIIGKGLKPGLKSYQGNPQGKPAWWVQSEYNWNTVCNSGMLIGSLAVADSDPQFAKLIIPSVLASLPKAIASYEPDGPWPEGPNYWDYATRYTVYGLSALQTALGTDFGLSKSTGFAQTGNFPLLAVGPTGLFINFADTADKTRRQGIPSLFWLAKQYNIPVYAMAERDLISTQTAVPEHFIWYVPAQGGRSDSLPLDKYFGGLVEIAVFRSAWNDKNALFLSVKAGFNQVNHGHLDLGTFELHALGHRWARDLGGEDYALPGYSDSGPNGKRWSYYRLGSLSHNVPLLNNKNQDPTGKAKIEKFNSNSMGGFAIVDISSAYKDFSGLVKRGVAMVEGRRAVIVQDEFDLTQHCEVSWGMTTDAKIEASGGEAILRLGNQKMKAKILFPPGAVFGIESAERNPPESPNRGVSRLMIRLKNQKGKVTIAILIAPIWLEHELPVLMKEPKLKSLKEW